MNTPPISSDCMVAMEMMGEEAVVCEFESDVGG